MKIMYIQVFAYIKFNNTQTVLRNNISNPQAMIAASGQFGQCRWLSDKMRYNSMDPKYRYRDIGDTRK